MRSSWVVALLGVACSSSDPARDPPGDALPSETTGGKATSGGTTTGGALTGGAPTGGAPTGGAPTGGAPTGGAPTGGAPSATGGRAAAGEHPATTGGRGEPASAGGLGGAVVACDDPTLDFEARCQACAEDACARCLCDECPTETEACQRTAGCAEIAACVVETACAGAACFCGDADALRCLSGESNGPCKDVILNAPGGRTPSLDNPSAGPASDAAVALSSCTEPPAGVCSTECR
jgi:hypothetical protein